MVPFPFGHWSSLFLECIIISGSKALILGSKYWSTVRVSEKEGKRLSLPLLAKTNAGMEGVPAARSHRAGEDEEKKKIAQEPHHRPFQQHNTHTFAHARLLRSTDSDRQR